MRRDKNGRSFNLYHWPGSSGIALLCRNERDMVRRLLWFASRVIYPEVSTLCCVLLQVRPSHTLEAGPRLLQFEVQHCSTTSHSIMSSVWAAAAWNRSHCGKDQRVVFALLDSNAKSYAPSMPRYQNPEFPLPTRCKARSPAYPLPIHEEQIWKRGADHSEER